MAEHEPTRGDAPREVGVAVARYSWPLVRKHVEEGGVVYLTHHRKRRVALVPVPVGRAIARALRVTPQREQSLWVRDNLAEVVERVLSGQVVLITWQAGRSPHVGETEVAAVVPHAMAAVAEAGGTTAATPAA